MNENPYRSPTVVEADAPAESEKIKPPSLAERLLLPVYLCSAVVCIGHGLRMLIWTITGSMNFGANLVKTGFVLGLGVLSLAIFIDGVRGYLKRSKG